MSEQNDYTTITIYGIGRSQRECHGHGDFSNVIAIRPEMKFVNRQYIDEFPPFFLTKQEADEYIRLIAPAYRASGLVAIPLQMRLSTQRLADSMKNIL